jgi:hypothetical protein
MFRPACSCARVAAFRSCCAATATVATATAAGSAHAWRATRLAARAARRYQTSWRGRWPTPRGRGAGANAAVRAVKVQWRAMAMVAKAQRDAPGLPRPGCQLLHWPHGHTHHLGARAGAPAPTPRRPPQLTTAGHRAWLCRRCTRPQPGLVRQGFLRHGLRPASAQGGAMTIAPDLVAQILRLHDAEKWRVGTIARQLHVHRDTVRRVLAQRPAVPPHPCGPAASTRTGPSS